MFDDDDLWDDNLYLKQSSTAQQVPPIYTPSTTRGFLAGEAARVEVDPSVFRIPASYNELARENSSSRFFSSHVAKAVLETASSHFATPRPVQLDAPHSEKTRWQYSERHRAHVYAFTVILRIMRVDHGQRSDGFYLVNKLKSMHRMLDRHIEDCEQDASLDPHDSQLGTIEYTKEEAQLFLKALEHLYQVARDAEAYHSRPSCTML